MAVRLSCSMECHLSMHLQQAQEEEEDCCNNNKINKPHRICFLYCRRLILIWMSSILTYMTFLMCRIWLSQCWVFLSSHVSVLVCNSCYWHHNIIRQVIATCHSRDTSPSHRPMQLSQVAHRSLSSLPLFSSAWPTKVCLLVFSLTFSSFTVCVPLFFLLQVSLLTCLRIAKFKQQ